MEQNPMPFLEGKEIRYVIFEDEKWFSVVDIIEILTESHSPYVYWQMVKHALLKQYNGVSFWNKLELESKDGKMKGADCANTEGVLRIVMSIPSLKAEPLKLWFAEQAMNRIEKS
jgi:DNA-damage-inducible protein D